VSQLPGHTGWAVTGARKPRVSGAGENGFCLRTYLPCPDKSQPISNVERE